MAASCPSIIRFCRTRVTRLTATGAVAAGPNNSYVSNGAVSLALDPQFTTGTESTNENGCGVAVATDKTPDRFNRWNLTLTMAKFEPGLFEILTGTTVVLDGADPIGIIGADQFATDFENSLAAIEGWSDARLGDAPDPTRPYFYLLLPATFWNVGAFTLQNGFTNIPVVGSSQGNNAWGNGPYDDIGISTNVTTWMLTQLPNGITPPDAACGYASVTPGS